MLSLLQVIESKQKWITALPKLLEIPNMDSEQKHQILENIMELMAEINDKENVIEQKSENKPKTSE